MSVANYTTSVLGHSQIVVGVKYSTSVDADSIKFVLDKLNSHKKLVINDAGCAINIRFDCNASPQNSKWGLFQAHRQIYGLIYIAEATNPMEAALILDKFNKLKEEYNPGLYHSRCIIFGIDTTIRPSHNHDVFQFSSHNAWKSFDHDIKELITSIFYELESKRLKMSQEKSSKPPAIFAPFESEDKMGESDSKTMKKKFLGRHQKHLSDTLLLVGQLYEALLSYNTALDTLVSTNDTIWVGSALEGLCVVSAQILLSDIDDESNSHAKDKSSSNFLLDPRNLTQKVISGPSMTELKKLCIPTIKDLVDRYREAIIHYSRYKSLAVIEMEACIKATKVFAQAKKFLEASEFIQNAVYITLNVSDAERLQRYSVMADLYGNIGFHRKSSFYKRVAAMQCVAPHIKEPDWTLCNELLLKTVSVPTHHFSYIKDGHGWPNIGLRVLREVIFSLEKINNHNLAIKHRMYMLLNMYKYLSESDETEICNALENYAKKIKRDPDMSEVDTVSSELNFYGLPVVEKVTPIFGEDGMRPVKSKTGIDAQSVFIYTPASFQTQNHEQKRIHFTWCVNAACRFDFDVFNPLTHCSLRITELSLILDPKSAAVDCQPASFTILPQSTSKISVILTSVEPGEVKILGYAFQIFGTQARCYFEKNDCIETAEITIVVISELPLLKCTQSSKSCKERDGVPLINCYLGETSKLPFLLANVGQQPVTEWIITFKSKPNEKNILLSVAENSAKLPLYVGKSVQFPVQIESKLFPSDKQLETYPCVVCVKYAGVVGDDKWWRFIDLEIILKPSVSVVVKSLDIIDAELNSDTECHVLMTIENALKDSVEIQYDCVFEGELKNSMIIPCNNKTILKVKMHKMKFPFQIDESTSIEDISLSFITKSLNLHWKTISAENENQHNGTVCLNNTLLRDSVCRLLEFPVRCIVSLDNEFDPSLHCYIVDIGVLTCINFKFSNVSESCHSIDAKLEVFQDQKNGFIEWNLKESVLCIGCSVETLSINSEENINFPCEILFLRAGEYSVRVSFRLHFLSDISFKNSFPKTSVICYSKTVSIDVHS